jgi:hypothetical protein
LVAVVTLVTVAIASALAACGGSGLVDVAWHHKSVSTDGREIEVVAVGGGCDTGPAKVDVDESVSSVRIAVRLHHTSNADCTAVLTPITAIAVLRDPLGSRAILGECDPTDDTPAGRQCQTVAGL